LGEGKAGGVQGAESKLEQKQVFLEKKETASGGGQTEHREPKEKNEMLC